MLFVVLSKALCMLLYQYVFCMSIACFKYSSNFFYIKQHSPSSLLTTYLVSLKLIEILLRCKSVIFIVIIPAFRKHIIDHTHNFYDFCHKNSFEWLQLLQIDVITIRISYSTPLLIKVYIKTRIPV